MTTTDTVTPGPLQPASTARPSASALVSIAGRQALVALRFLLAMTVIVGIAYPLLILGIGQLATKGAANGSLVTDNTGTVVGSKLIGQRFDGPQINSAQWFAGRPSAAGDGYDAMSSGGSNRPQTARTCSPWSSSAARRSPPTTASTRRTSRRMR